MVLVTILFEATDFKDFSGLGWIFGVRYNPVDLCSEGSFGTNNFGHYNRVFVMTKFDSICQSNNLKTMFGLGF